MHRGLSLWLDVLRAVATLVVVFSHFAYARFSGGDLQWFRDYNFGSDAVVVIFVVSGFVIAFAAGRDGTAGAYAFNRLTRLWSVLIPALILTLVFDRYGSALTPAAYPAGYYAPQTIADKLIRGVTFSNEFRSLERLRLGTNGPLWSLSYEAVYYALFGVAIFWTGARRMVAIVAIAAIAGLPILMLMPAWLMGVWTWHFAQWGGIARLSTSRALILAFGAPLIYVVMQWLGTPDQLLALSGQMLGVNMNATFGFSDEFMWNAIIGALCVGHVIGMGRFMQNARFDLPVMRWIAGGVFRST